MLSAADYENEELIRTIGSERYGSNHIDWKKHLSMGYVQEFEVITGDERDAFIKKCILSAKDHWDKEVPNLLDELLRINERLQASKRYTDTRYIISEFMEGNDHKNQVTTLIELIS
jgi:hypothetical protein